MKYHVGMIVYMKRKYGKFKEDEPVEIIEVIKKPKDTFLKLRNMSGQTAVCNSKCVRKRKRYI